MELDPKMMLDPAIVDDPYPFYDALRNSAPVWKASSQDIYTVTSFDLLADAARRIEDFSSVMTDILYKDDDEILAKLEMKLGEPTLAVADPPAHTAHKQMIFPKFVSKRMALIENDLRDFAEDCIERTVQMGQFDFMEEIGIAVPIRAIAMLIGFEDSDDALLARTAFDLVELTSSARTMAELGQVQLNHDEIRTWLTNQLDRRKGGETEHLLDAIKTAVNSGEFSHDQAMTTLMTLLAAGGESTSSLLGNAVRILAENPDIRRKLQDDPTMVPNFIEEAGRLKSPFRSHLRSVPRSTSLGGVELPAGSTLMMMWGAANRDPAKFDDPAAVHFGRKLQHVTFGRGIHLCVGAALARMEARIVITSLLRWDHFPVLGESGKPGWVYSLQVRRHAKLPMSWPG